MYLTGEECKYQILKTCVCKGFAKQLMPWSLEEGGGADVWTRFADDVAEIFAEIYQQER